MAITCVYAVVSVADLDSALAWYDRLLGRPADRHPMDGLAEWRMGEAGGIQLVRDADRAGAAQLTLGVDDLEGYVAALADRDLPVEAITTGEMARFVVLADPEGNMITLAESLPASG